MTEEPLVIHHHPCHDGMAAAWAIKTANPGVELYPANYRMGPPLKEAEGRRVILADYSYKLPDMLKLVEVAETVEIYDHHKTAVEELVEEQHLREERGLRSFNVSHFKRGFYDADGSTNVTAFIDLNRSGARICWEVFHPNQAPPEWLLRVEDYDLWRFDYGNTEAVMGFIRSVPKTFEDYTTMHNRIGTPDGFEWATKVGASIQERDMLAVDQLAAYAEPHPIAGENFITVRGPYHLASYLGNHLAVRHSLPAAVYMPTSTGWKFSLRSLDSLPDVSEVAKKMGGGGHRNSSGFSCKKLPWVK